MSILGDRLRRHARWLNITDSEAARRAELDPRRYHHYLTGRHEPHLDLLVKICLALGITPDQALGLAPLPFELPEAPGQRERLLQILQARLDRLPERDLGLVTKLVDELLLRTDEPR